MGRAEQSCFPLFASGGRAGELHPRWVPHAAALEGAEDHRAVGLNQRQGIGLGRLVPTLLCGEQSAVAVFGRESRRHEEADGQAVLQSIMQDEMAHEVVLARLRKALPVPADLGERMADSRRFFRSLGSTDATLSFLRISELDSCLCIILAAILNESSLPRGGVVHALFAQLRRDEAHHVKISRRQLAGRRIDSELYERETVGVRQRLADLLRPVADGFTMLDIAAEPLLARIARGATGEP